MNENSHIATQYLALKDQVQDRIKFLQAQCYDQSNTRISDPVQNPQIQIPNSQILNNLHPNYYHYHYCCCSHFHCQDSTPSMNSSCSAVIKNIPHDNYALNEVLVQSLKAQKEMNNNIRLLNDKISDFSGKRSQTSNFIQQANSSRNRRPIYFPSTDRQQLSPMIERSKSETGLRIKQGIKHRDAEEKNIVKKNKKQIKSKSKNYNMEYYNENKKKKKQKCPIHDLNDLEEMYQNRVKIKEIYRDSTHRNRKHERSHLVSAFKQQQKSRKELLTKLCKNYSKIK